jgi:hypothetical protein
MYKMKIFPSILQSSAVSLRFEFCLCLMSCIFQNIDPPSPSPPGECVPPAFVAGEGHTRRVERGWGVNILEDARHSSVFYLFRILFGRCGPNLLHL